ncbi:hypothetical protein EG329_000280 [Mollisiaceae sp. DMI_Dod_QoI]|nr:hypothetical protein EG329_000280 [Helotiales sp. DMI_Dod_QoI]
MLVRTVFLGIGFIQLAMQGRIAMAGEKTSSTGNDPIYPNDINLKLSDDGSKPLPAKRTENLVIVIPASQDWKGNDGPWSTFTIQVGTPPQDVEVFIGTSAHQVVVVDPRGCDANISSNCLDSRGGTFQHDLSSSWNKNLANLSSDVYDLRIETILGYSGKGEYGFDTVTLGWQGSGGPSLTNQTVAAIATGDFYLGLLGLTPRPTNFSTYDNPVSSFMENLKSRDMIPSTSWSYTAGNQYRLNKVPGSLVLGGYDTSKFIQNDVTFSFNEVDLRDLTVNILNITFSNSSTSIQPLMPSNMTSIAAFVDSSIPQLWLPTSVCHLFSDTFGLTYDPIINYYLVNTTQHDLLTAQNPNVTFILGNLSSTTTVPITFPYTAFDMQLSSPIAENATYYFPLKRAANDTQYTLGRAFLQEAYLTADYERRNFSISQCAWDAGAEENIVAIQPLYTGSSSGSTLSTGAIIAISICGFLVLVLISVAYLFWRRRQRSRRRVEATPEPVQEFQKPELAGQECEVALPQELNAVNEVVEMHAKSQDPMSREMPEMAAREGIGGELNGRGQLAELESPVSLMTTAVTGDTWPRL